MRRSVQGYITYAEEGAEIVIDIYNINAQPLMPYQIDPTDQTTMKLIFAVQAALMLPNSAGKMHTSLRLRLSHFVNMKYYEALTKWGFKPDGEKALSLVFK